MTPTEYTEFRLRLKQLRTDMDLSQKEVAESCNISRKIIWRIENTANIAQCTIKLLYYYALAGVDITHLLTGMTQQQVRDVFAVSAWPEPEIKIWAETKNVEDPEFEIESMPESEQQSKLKSKPQPVLTPIEKERIKNSELARRKKPEEDKYFTSGWN